MMAGHWNSPEDVPVGPKLSGRGLRNEEVDVVVVGDVNIGCFAMVQAPHNAAPDSPVWKVRGLTGSTGPRSLEELAALSGSTFGDALRLARERAYRRRHNT
jgi:hypothetical protein